MLTLAASGPILLDTNVLIYHLKGVLPAPLKELLAQALTAQRLCQRDYAHGNASLVWLKAARRGDRSYCAGAPVHTGNRQWRRF